MRNAAPTHYELLGVSRTASQDEIKSAYRQQVMRNHPDHGGNAALFGLLDHAYEVLSSPTQRAAYDAELNGPRPQRLDITPPGGTPPVADQDVFNDDIPYRNDPAESPGYHIPNSGRRAKGYLPMTWSMPFRVARFLLVLFLLLWVITALMVGLSVIPGVSNGDAFWLVFWLLMAWKFGSLALRLCGWLTALLSITAAFLTDVPPVVTAARLAIAFGIWLCGHWFFVWRKGRWRSLLAFQILTRLPPSMRPDRRWNGLANY